MSKNKSASIKPLNSFKKDNTAMVEKIADEWVGGGITIESASKTDIPKNLQMKLIDESRFTIVIPTYLHTRIKKHCAINSTPMKLLLTEILLKEFPER